MKLITTEDLKKKIDGGDDFVLVEVIGPETFAEYHIPGAINVPVDDTFEDEIVKTVPEKDKMVVVYCYGIECHASPKAAKRMAALGYTNVYEYQTGKDGWKAAGNEIVTD